LSTGSQNRTARPHLRDRERRIWPARPHIGTFSCTRVSLRGSRRGRSVDRRCATIIYHEPTSHQEMRFRPRIQFISPGPLRSTMLRRFYARTPEFHAAILGSGFGMYRHAEEHESTERKAAALYRLSARAPAAFGFESFYEICQTAELLSSIRTSLVRANMSPLTTMSVGPGHLLRASVTPG